MSGEGRLGGRDGGVTAVLCNVLRGFGVEVGVRVGVMFIGWGGGWDV